MYCGEHSVIEQETGDSSRIHCPLDPKHSVEKWRLEKHLLVCNAKQPDEVPNYIKKGYNLGDPSETDDAETFRLQDLPKAELDSVVSTIEDLFAKFVDGTIKSNIKEHAALAEELAKEEYGIEKRRHLLQTSSILGIMEHEGFLESNTCFIEYGAGKAALSFWLAAAVEDIESSKVLVVDRASHRNKKDNQIKDRDRVDRIRADIADLDLSGLDTKSESFVGVSKHLCGVATDLTLRCMVQGNQHKIKSRGFIICLCCHHACDWSSFVGKKWLEANGIDRKTFNIMIKIVSWSVCGDGRNREKRKTDEKDEPERQRKEMIGWKCKRVIDFARIKYMADNNYDMKLSFYADKSATLENICLIGKYQN